MNEEKKKIISILRSLIISSPQKGKSIRELTRDFHEFEGSRIPIFEHRSVEEFLRASGEFVIENFRGELIIYEKPNSESWHISKLVAEQHKPKKRASVASRFRQAVRQPQPHSAYPINNTRSPTKSVFPKRFNHVSNTQRGPQSIPDHQRKQTTTMEYTFDQYKPQQAENNYGQNRFANDTPNTFSNRYSSNDTTDLTQANRQSQSNRSNQPNQSFDLRNRINEIRGAPPVAYVDLTLNDSIDSKISANKTTTQSESQIVKKSPPISPKTTENFDSSKQPNDTQQITAPILPTATVQQPPPLLTSNPFFDVSQPPPNMNVLGSRIQDRLKNPPKYDAIGLVNKNIGANNDKKTVNDRLLNARQTPSVIDFNKDGRDSDFNRNVKATPQESPALPLREPFQSKKPPSLLNEQFLINYCDENQLSRPVYKLFKVNNRFQCHVTIDQIRYSTYPTDYSSESEARFETATHAMERLKSIKNLQKYAVCLDDEVELAIKIYNCIKDCSTGVFMKKIPDKFLAAYEQVLPSNWSNIVAKYPKCFTMEDCIDDQIVYVVDEVEFYVHDQKMDKLNLPWDEEYWCLIITSTISTKEIWGRLIGKEHSNALELLIIDIEMDLMTNKQIAKVFNVGQIYLVLISECGYRVRVDKVDITKQQCYCFFIDDGDQRWFDMNEMFVCQSKFTKFPPQAIRFSLYGLEEFAENDFATKHLEDTLLNRSLIGQIFTKKDDFISQEESNDLEPIVQVVFYDTSTEDDINLHPIIVEKICADIPPPELVHLKLTQVYVSHIADNGDVFCQLEKNGVHYVNKLIHKLTQTDVSVRLQTVPVTGNSNKKLFLVFDEDTLQWCRGKLIKEAKEGNTMFFIDYGKTKVVPLSKIYRLESLSQALMTFPPQAIQTKLSGFNEFPENLVSTLRGYFSGDAFGYVMKMQPNSIVPDVNLYFVKESVIVMVNDSLKLEQERLSNDRKSSSSLSRQCSTSSNNGRPEERKDDLMPSFDNLMIDNRKSLPKLATFQPPELGAFFGVEVVMAPNPSNFVIRPYKYMPQWTIEMKRLQDYCSKSRDTMQWNMIEIGQAYACLRSDGCYYRAIVEFHCDSQIHVYFCDVGDIENIDDVKKLKCLPEDYRVLPKLAITAELSGIKPINSYWEMDDSKEFDRITSGKKFQAVVVKIKENEKRDHNAVLEIRLIDVSKADDVCINDFFVAEGRAIRD